MSGGFAEFHTPVQFNELLTYAGVVDDVYRAMASPDVADVVMAVIDAMKRTSTMPRKVKVQKAAGISTKFRNMGNAAYGKSQYQDALVHYNTALLFAPNHSRELKLAYSNRSALLYKLNAFYKCIIDIECVLLLGMPDDIKEKLHQRYLVAKSCIKKVNLYSDLNHPPFCRSFFEFDVKKNPQIPCASDVVGVIVQNKIPKVVATNHVKVGTVLAIEPAFVSITATRNYKLCCYYCQKFEMNLMPCNSCCIALFCSEQCRAICLKEYHSIECQVMEVLELIGNAFMSTPRITVKAVLKMMYLSKNWEEFVAESQLLGLERVKESSINKIYDVNHKYSLLNAIDKRHFLYGALYNASVLCAATIHTLESVKLFPQKSADSVAVKRAFARTYMHLYLHSGLTELVQPVSCDKLERTEYFKSCNFGWFSFLGKLKNSCQPNCLMFNLNRRMALVAIQPIKSGEELTVLLIDPLHHTEPKLRQQLMLCYHSTICPCSNCINQKPPKPTPLSGIQRLKFDKLDLYELERNYSPTTSSEVFKKTCKALTFLSNAKVSEEYEDTFALFKKSILCCQEYVCENKLLDYIET